MIFICLSIFSQFSKKNPDFIKFFGDTLRKFNAPYTLDAEAMSFFLDIILQFIEQNIYKLIISPILSCITYVLQKRELKIKIFHS